MHLDNTLPVLRYSESERAALKGKIVDAAAKRTAPAADANADAAAIAAAAAAIATVAINAAAPEASQGDDAAEPARDPRAEVMAEYFDVMRGFLEQQRAVVESWQARTAEAVADSPEASGDLPFIDEILVHEEDRIVARCSLSLAADNFLRSHVLSGPVSEGGELSGLACVPLMVSVEILAEACSVLAGSRSLHVIENVRAFDWIALDDEALTLEVHAETVDAEQGLYRATIFDGASLVVTADFRFTPDFRLAGLAELGPARPSRWSGPELYSTGMFHGPVFQSVRRIAGWNEAGIDAELFEAGASGLLLAGRDAAPGPRSGPARRRRPGRRVLGRAAGGRRLQLLPIDDRPDRAVRAMPRRHVRLDDARPAAAARGRPGRHFGGADLELRMP